MRLFSRILICLIALGVAGFFGGADVWANGGGSGNHAPKSHKRSKKAKRHKKKKKRCCVPCRGKKRHARKHRPVVASDMLATDRDTGPLPAFRKASDDQFGMFGRYPRSRDVGAHSWQPDSTPGIHGTYVPTKGWLLYMQGHTHMGANLQQAVESYNPFITGYFSGAFRKNVNNGTVMMRLAASPDLIMSTSGYRQTLQTAYVPSSSERFAHRKAPAELITEIAAGYSLQMSKEMSIYTYAGAPGQVAFGPASYFHRYSSQFNPEAPLTYRWFDSLNTSFGTGTLGLTYGFFKVEGSIFNAKYPDLSRYKYQGIRPNSPAVRMTLNASPHWSAGISHARLRTPYRKVPSFTSIDRTLLYVEHDYKWGDLHFHTLTGAGRDHQTNGQSLQAFIFEPSLRYEDHVFFARLERVGLDTLKGLPTLTTRIAHNNKFAVGYAYDYPYFSHFSTSLGGMVAIHNVDKRERKTLSTNPLSGMVFFRLGFLPDSQASTITSTPISTRPSGNGTSKKSQDLLDDDDKSAAE